MKWNRFGDKFPDTGSIILYNDGNISIGIVDEKGNIYSEGYYCNNKKCDWIYDDCDCSFVIDKEHSWIYIPEDLQEK